MKKTADSSLADSDDERDLSSLMRKSQDGDTEAYRQLLFKVDSMIQSYVKNSLFRFGYRAEGAADDLVQEILLGLHAKRHTYEPARFFLPWLYAIARYKVIDFIREIRKRSRLIAMEPEYLDTSVFAPEPALAQLDSKILLDSLPKKQRDILRMVKLEGLSVSEVSVRTGYSASDIKVTVHRALKALQHKFKEPI